jgi:hypothetical protein
MGQMGSSKTSPFFYQRYIFCSVPLSSTTNRRGPAENLLQAHRRRYDSTVHHRKTGKRSRRNIIRHNRVRMTPRMARRIILVLSVIAACIVCDQSTKELCAAWALTGNKLRSCFRADMRRRCQQSHRPHRLRRSGHRLSQRGDRPPAHRNLQCRRHGDHGGGNFTC